MQLCSPRFSRVATAVAIALAGFCAAGAASAASAVATVAGMPPVVNPDNLYSEAGADHMSPAVAGALPRIYVPNLRSNDVYVIDPATLKVVDRFHVGFSPQHVVPAWDLQTLWVANNAEGRPDGSLTPIDPKTGKPGKQSWSTIPTTCTSRRTAKKRSWWPKRARDWTFAMHTRWR